VADNPNFWLTKRTYGLLFRWRSKAAAKHGVKVLYQWLLKDRSWPDAELPAKLMELVRQLTTQRRPSQRYESQCRSLGSLT